MTSTHIDIKDTLLLEKFQDPADLHHVLYIVLISLLPIGLMIIALGTFNSVPLAMFGFHAILISGILIYLFLVRQLSVHQLYVWLKFQFTLQPPFIPYLINSFQAIDSIETNLDIESHSLAIESHDLDMIFSRFAQFNTKFWHSPVMSRFLWQVIFHKLNHIKFCALLIGLITPTLFGLYFLLRPYFPTPNLHQIGLTNLSIGMTVFCGIWFSSVNPLVEELFWRSFMNWEYGSYLFWRKLFFSVLYSGYHFVVLFYMFPLEYVFILFFGILLLGLAFHFLYIYVSFPAAVSFHITVDSVAVLIIATFVFPNFVAQIES